MVVVVNYFRAWVYVSSVPCLVASHRYGHAAVARLDRINTMVNHHETRPSKSTRNPLIQGTRYLIATGYKFNNRIGGML